MGMHRASNHPAIEVRGFKWPHRPTSVTVASLLGEDRFGRWLGATKGDPWWSADRSRSGVFDYSFIKLVPSGTFWTVCFHPVDPLVDVDIVLPVRWGDGVLEEVDLEVDILRCADGSVRVRDQDEFEVVRRVWSMPDEIAAQVEATCKRVRALVEQGAEPFGDVGRRWLAGFLAETDAASGESR
jgi:uncharacterized protein